MQVPAHSFPYKNPMRAFILHGKEDLRRGELPTPVAQPGQVLVQVRRVGISASQITGDRNNQIFLANFGMGSVKDWKSILCRF
jgi:hypothetical protein